MPLRDQPILDRTLDFNSGCIRCVEAGRYDASQFHSLQQCPYPYQGRSMQPNRPQTPRMKVLFVQDQNYQIDHQFDSVPCLPDAHTFYEDQTQNESQVHEENEHFGDYSDFYY